MDKILISLWILAHCVLLYLSGYAEKMLVNARKLPYSNWSELTQYTDKFFPFSTTNLLHYDITEFFVYVVGGLIIYRIIRKFYQVT